MKTLSSNYYLYILGILEHMGLDRDRIDHIVPIDLAGDLTPNTRLDIDALHDLLEFAKTDLQTPHIGMVISHSFKISNYGYAGSIFALCNTIEHAINVAKRYGCLAHTLGKFNEAVPSPAISNGVQFVWTPSFDIVEEEKYKQISECILSNYVLTINWLAWSFPSGVKKLTLKHSPIEPKETYEQILGCEVEFKAAEYSLHLDTDTLRLPLTTSNPIKFSKLQQTLNQELAKFNQTNDIMHRARFEVYKMMDLKNPSLKAVAQELSLSERTLKRRLKTAETNFQDILKSVKMDLFEKYQQEGLSYSEIAQRLWYFDQSALTRAYKNWHGHSPTQKKAQRR